MLTGKATSLGELLEWWWPIHLPKASWGKGEVATVRAQGLLQLLLIYSSGI